ncbi:MAG: YdhR family protein [Chloroflexales bacterium]|nr:YdhR family protein [Chloroflexales bacterium]
MHVLIITFELAGLDAATYAAHASLMAPRFAAMPGLVSKVFLADPATNTYGGVYLWASREDLDAYLASETYRALQANPAFAPLTVRAFATLAEASAQTAGPLASLAA